MKTLYRTLLAALILSPAFTHAQTVNQIYDHDSTEFTQLYNMPFDESRLLVVAGFDSYASHTKLYEYDDQNSQLIEMVFSGVDTIYGVPTLHEDKIFFASYTNGLGIELSAFDGTATYSFDFNLGTGDSNPVLATFEDELFVIASDGSNRQLYKYMGGTSFFQISEETQADVAQFIAQRGDQYVYSINNQAIKQFKSTVDNNGILTHSTIAPTNINETVEDVVMMNGDIYMLSAFYSIVDASYRVDKIDATNLITTYHYETAGQISSGHILAFNNELLYYRTEPGHIEVLDISNSGQPVTFMQMPPQQYNYILGHVVKNGRLFFYGDTYIVELSSMIFNFVLEDANLLQNANVYETDTAFYMYEINPTVGNNSNVLEVNTITNDFVRYPVSTEGGYMYLDHPMVENNGNLKFIFKTEGLLPSTDIYSFDSVLSVDDKELSEIEVYPNPSSDGNWILEAPMDVKVQITTTDGKIVANEVVVEGINAMPSLPTGLYLVHIGGTTKKLLVR